MNKLRLLLVTLTEARVLDYVPSTFADAILYMEKFLLLESTPPVSVVQLQVLPPDKLYYCPYALLRHNAEPIDREYELIFVDTVRNRSVSLIKWVNLAELRELTKQYIDFVFNEVGAEPKQQYQIGMLEGDKHIPLWRRYMTAHGEEWREIDNTPDGIVVGKAVT